MLIFVQGDKRLFNGILFSKSLAQPADLTSAILSLNFPRQGGGTVKRTNGTVPVLSSQVVVSPPADEPGQIVLPDNGLVDGDVVQLTAMGGGTLPSPLMPSTNYTILNIDLNVFNFIDSSGNPVVITDQGTVGFTMLNANDIQLGENPLLGQFIFNLRSPVAAAINAALAQTFQIGWQDASGNFLNVIVQNLLDVYAQPAP